jgi:hypothetical protein
MRHIRGEEDRRADGKGLARARHVEEFEAAAFVLARIVEQHRQRQLAPADGVRTEVDVPVEFVRRAVHGVLQRLHEAREVEAVAAVGLEEQHAEPVIEPVRLGPRLDPGDIAGAIFGRVATFELRPGRLQRVTKLADAPALLGAQRLRHDEHLVHRGIEREVHICVERFRALRPVQRRLAGGGFL